MQIARYFRCDPCVIMLFSTPLSLGHYDVWLLWLDGVYEETTGPAQRKPRLHRTRAPTSAQLTELA
ncbi:hypothetical protein ACVSNK_25325, partial [Pseudomonas aeruginosa]